MGPREVEYLAANLTYHARRSLFRLRCVFMPRVGDYAIKCTRIGGDGSYVRIAMGYKDADLTPHARDDM
jgi:hypothetical protein